MKCPNCGKEIVNDSVFCEYCGEKIVQSSAKKKLPIWLIVGAAVLIVGVVLGIGMSSNEATNLPDDLGDFQLGMSRQTVMSMLNARGLSEVDTPIDVGVGDDKFPTYSYDVFYSDTIHKSVIIRFSDSSPYIYDGKKWEWVIIDCYNEELFEVQLVECYKGQSGFEECLNIYQDEEQRLQSLYQNFETESKKEEDTAYRVYAYENKALYLQYFKDEDLTSSVMLTLTDTVKSAKAFGINL